MTQIRQLVSPLLRLHLSRLANQLQLPLLASLPVPLLAVRALLTQLMLIQSQGQSQVLVHNDKCAELKCMAPLIVK